MGPPRLRQGWHNKLVTCSHGVVVVSNPRTQFAMAVYKPRLFFCRCFFQVLLMVADLAVEKAARREKAAAADAHDSSTVSSESASTTGNRPPSAPELNALATRMVNAEALVAAPRGAAAAGTNGVGGSHGGTHHAAPRVHLTPIVLAAQYGHLQVCCEPSTSHSDMYHHKALRDLFVYPSACAHTPTHD